MSATNNTVYVYTDGACRGNPGPGGWAVLLCYGNTTKELYGAEAHTTNNRMELLAAIEGLEALKRPMDVVLTTDSLYLLKGISEWLPRWIRKNWKTSGNQTVKNVDLWKRLVVAQSVHQVRWEWVKAHNGHPKNERVDWLARQAIDTLTHSL